MVVRRTGEPTPMKTGRDVWWHDAMRGRVRDLQARRARRRAPAVHALHERHHRQAEGHPAHDRRLPDPRRDHGEGDLRPQGRRHVLVHGGRRLGDGPLLRRLRAPRQRRDRAHVRGRADASGARPLLGHHRAPPRDASSTPRRRRSARSSGSATSTRTSTTSRRCACSARSASRSTPRRGSGTTA